jgi:hypothetical protein
MNTFTILGWFTLGIAGIILGPIATIWSLNTLFSLNIPYEFETWCAVVWLTMVTFGNVVTTIKGKK